MGKLELVALVAGVVGLIGIQSLEAPPEEQLVESSVALISMTRPEFEAWCESRGASTRANLDERRAGTVTCAWIDESTGRVWHAALHFDGDLLRPTKADAGLVEASEPTLMRLVSNAFGSRDTHTGEGFPVWEVDADGAPCLLTVAPFEDITLIRMTRTSERPVLSMR